MAAPRSTSLRALRSLSQQHPTSSFAPAEFRRNLHITGAQSARPVNGPDRQSLYRSRSLADLKGECQKRSLGTSGNKSELVDRLSNHDVLQSRAFSIAMRKIDSQAFSSGGSNNSSNNNNNNSTSDRQRHFNTSRANKTVKDSSTVDFVYMPTDYTNPDLPVYMSKNFPSTFDLAGHQQPIPAPPDAYAHRAGSPGPSSPPPSGMKPEIHYVGEMSSDNGPSPMSEVVDNDAADINPFELTEQVGRARRYAVASSSSPSQAQVGDEGVVKELWGGFMEDVFGKKTSSSRSN